MTGSSGVSRTLRLLDFITSVSGILGRPVKPGDDSRECGVFVAHKLLPDSIFKPPRHKGLIPSLQANGSRECAPDDRLREAIHVAAKLKSGLLRRFAPRNDVEYDSAISRREAPEVCVNFFWPSITEGAGNAGCPLHPQPRVRI